MVTASKKENMRKCSNSLVVLEKYFFVVISDMVCEILDITMKTR